MDDTLAIWSLTAARAADTGALDLARTRGRSPRAAPERLTVADAFRRHAGIDLLAASSTATAGRGGRADR